MTIGEGFPLFVQSRRGRHSDYVPEPSNPVAPYPNGWSPKRLAVGALAQAVLDRQPAPWPPAKTVTPRGA